MLKYICMDNIKLLLLPFFLKWFVYFICRGSICRCSFCCIVVRTCWNRCGGLFEWRFRCWWNTLWTRCPSWSKEWEIDILILFYNWSCKANIVCVLNPFTDYGSVKAINAFRVRFMAILTAMTASTIETFCS